ncbi:hypothetical protein H0E87_014829 [Populus deltoides]|nr:hypothetical protein H0E87_014829 [Populus deltoides]
MAMVNSNELAPTLSRVDESFLRFSVFYAWAVMRTTFLLITNRHSACKMAPLGSDSKDHPTAATHLTGGSHTLSARVSHFLTAEHRHKAHYINVGHATKLPSRSHAVTINGGSLTCLKKSISKSHFPLRFNQSKMVSTFSGDETAPFFGFLGAAAALVFSCMGAAYGTAKSGVGVASMGVMRPELVMKSIVPVVMAGVLGIYGLIIAVIISTGINPKAKSYYLFDGYAHLSSGLACGLAGLSAGMAIGIVGDAGVR